MEFSKKIIKVLVVDDSAFMRKVITDILSEDKRMSVIGTAKNGLEAVSKSKELNPDVITLDVEMPVMDGLNCLKELLSIGKFPVIMLSSVTGEGAEATIKALEEGAVDFITKPVNIFDISAHDKKKEIIEKVVIASKTKITKVTKVTKVAEIRENNTRNIRRDEIAKQRKSEKKGELKYIIAIGTSTGGPKALQSVIPFFPQDMPAAVLIVQHMPPGFTKSLAGRLDSMSEINVKEAEEGDILEPGHAYLAPGNFHMLFSRNNNGIIISLDQSASVSGHRPSVDKMMSSLSDIGQKNIIGVIMTGMGSDGTNGLLKLKNENDAYVIGQDEQSCVVYGMPKAANNKGVVDEQVSLKNITNSILKYMGV